MWLVKKQQEDVFEMKKSGSAMLVHHDCRRQVIDPRKKVESLEVPAAKKLRSPVGTIFDRKNFCFPCEKKIEVCHQV